MSSLFLGSESFLGKYCTCLWSTIGFGQLHWWRDGCCLPGEGSITLPDSAALICKKFSLPEQKESFRPDSSRTTVKRVQMDGRTGIKPGSWPGITAQWGYSQNVLLWLFWHSPGPSCSLPLQRSTLSFLIFPFQLFIALVIPEGSSARAARQAACNNRGTKPAQEISWFD